MFNPKSTVAATMLMASVVAGAQEPQSIQAASRAIAGAMAQFGVYEQQRIYSEPASPEVVRKLMNSLPADTSPAVKSDVKALLSRSQLKQIPLSQLSADLTQRVQQLH